MKDDWNKIWKRAVISSVTVVFMIIAIAALMGILTLREITALEMCKRILICLYVFLLMLCAIYNTTCAKHKKMIVSFAVVGFIMFVCCILKLILLPGEGWRVATQIFIATVVAVISGIAGSKKKTRRR